MLHPDTRRLLRAPSGLLASSAACCCPDCGCPTICDDLLSTLSSSSCGCMDGLVIPLTYGTLFQGSVGLPGGSSYVPEEWDGDGVVGWEGSVSGCAATITQRLWCVPPLAPASPLPTNYRLLTYCQGNAVGHDIGASDDSTCDPISLEWPSIPIDTTIGNTYCNCGGGLVLTAAATITNDPSC